MLKVGLTGGIGSGKTAAANIFQKLGASIIDTDIIARELVDNNQQVLSEIIRIFGDSIINRDGKLDRKKLAQIVFNDNTKKQRLENILHPKIREQIQHQLKSINTTANYVIIVIPLLLETGFRDLIDRVLVVMADENTRIQRVLQRDGRNVDDIRAIIKSQVNDEKRQNEADDILKNNSNINELQSKVQQLHIKYLELSATGN